MSWFVVKPHYGGVEFWTQPEVAGWLNKQGEYIKTWRRRWFVMKKGKIFWFKNDDITADSIPRGVIDVNSTLAIKGAEDVLNKPFAFELCTKDNNMFFIAETEKEKEEWINAVGRSIVKHSSSLLEQESIDYTNTSPR